MWYFIIPLLRHTELFRKKVLLFHFHGDSSKISRIAVLTWPGVRLNISFVGRIMQKEVNTTTTRSEGRKRWRLTEPFMQTRDREGFVAFLRASSSVNHPTKGIVLLFICWRTNTVVLCVLYPVTRSPSFAFRACSCLLGVAQAIAAEFLGTAIFIFFSTGMFDCFASGVTVDCVPVG